MSALLSPEDWSLRPMRETDLAAVLDIERACYEFPWTEGIHRDCLRVGYSCWVAQGQRGIEGYGVMQVAAGEAHLLNICVAPATQGRGLGRVLLDHLLAIARGHHADMAFLEVRPSNRVALRLYAQAGFHEVGARRGYYPARQGREDALILACDLGRGADPEAGPGQVSPPTSR